jgi:hypothetical protein
MTRPRLLDLFAGAGGAAVGYARAGFDVVGVDICPQPHYPFEVHQADALTFPLEEFAAIHASPPCQRWANVTAWRGEQANHPDLLGPIRARLLAEARVPWVIENVPEAPIRRDHLLCGSMFGLKVKRHRVFETSWGGPTELQVPCGSHHRLLPFMHKGERAYADAMGCTWMTKEEAREAIPPAYTEFVGRLILHAHQVPGAAGTPAPACRPTPVRAQRLALPVVAAAPVHTTRGTP